MIFSSAQIARDNCYDENLHILVLISSYIIVHREQCRICLVLYAEGKKNQFLSQGHWANYQRIGYKKAALRSSQ